MSLSLIYDCRLEIEYDEKYATTKLADHRQSVAIYGDTPSERLKTSNWVQWCDRAALCTRFCRLCGCRWTPQRTPIPMSVVLSARRWSGHWVIVRTGRT